MFLDLLVGFLGDFLEIFLRFSFFLLVFAPLKPLDLAKSLVFLCQVTGFWIS